MSARTKTYAVCVGAACVLSLLLGFAVMFVFGDEVAMWVAAPVGIVLGSLATMTAQEILYRKQWW